MPGHHWIARCDRSVFFPVVRFALATALVALTAYTPIAMAMPAVPGIFPAPVTDGEFEEPVTPQQEHRKRVQAGVAVEALSHDLFGDQINGYTGSVSFSVTDISIPGNSDLSVAIARRVDINELRGRGAKQRSPHVFEDWDLDIPHLHGVFEASTGWRAGPTPGVRCNQPNAALAAPPAIGAIEADDYWSGNHLYVPGQGDDEINHLSATFPDRPTDGQTYHWITKGYWYFSCLTETANGVPGDAFLARDPDGNRYWFNQVVEKLYAPLFKDINNRIARRETIILPTRIEDRFGNWVQYTYHPDNPRNLIRIEANDGRYLDLTYSNHTLPSSHITTVTDGVRTWSYDYITALEGATLIGVGRPDGSAWTIDLGDFHADNVDTAFSGCGTEPGFVYGFEKRADFTHPSGATAEFTFAMKKHGRNGAPKNCWVGLNETGDRYPPLFTTWTVLAKSIGGPGIQTPLTWTWSFPTATWAYNFQCEPNCVQTKVISVLQPDGSQTKQEWGVHYGKNDGLLLAEERIRGAEVLRRTEYEYRIDPVNQAYPALVGTRTRLYPDVSSGVHKPAINSKIEQQGVEMESAVPSTGDVYAFDRFARATQAQRASTLGFNKNELVEYHHDLDTWVLGQIKKVTNSVTGKVEREIDYDPVTALPTTLKSFGRLASTLSHYPDGQLHTITDAAVKTTTFSNYKRGIPRDVEFDDNQSIAGVVSDAGFLTDYTDELGHTTHYDFDALGRLTGITHPVGDSVAWTPTTITFTKQLDDAYGIPEGHYKQSISTGNSRKEVYFDALWRPILTREWDQTNPGGTQRFTYQRYDSDGRVAFQAYPLDSVTTVDVISEGIESDYDPLGRLTETRASSELGTLTTTVEYLNNFQKRITNPRGKVTRIDFQVIDEATEELPIKIVAPEGATIDIVRDVYGKPKSITRSGTSPVVSATRRFVYDTNERLCKTIEPERGAEVIAYDTASRIDWTAPGTNLTTNFTDCQQGNVAPGDKIVRSYDLRDRLIGINYPDTTLDEARTYYDDGALKSVTRGSGPEEVTWSYTYNKRRLLEREQLKIDAALPQNTYTEWTYNALGHVSRLKYVDGFTLDYLPNALGQPTRVRGVGDGIDYASGISYHPNGALTGFTYGNQVVHTSTPNMRDLTGTISDIGTSTLLSYTHTYDENGNPTVITDGVAGNPDSKTLTYDDLDRLETVAAAGTFVSASMIYDGLDNLTKYQVGPRDYRYVINATTQRLDRINNAVGTQLISYQHDVRGNTTQKNQTGNNLVFLFDRANRLTEVKRNNTVVSAYRYDGNGRRIKTVKPDGDFRYQIYSQAGQYLWDANFDEDQASHQVIQTAYDYIHLGDRLIAKRKSQNSSTLPENQLPLFADGFETLLRGPEAPQSSNVEAKDLVANPFEPSATAAISVQYVHVDALGSPVAESDNVGSLIGSRTYYEPYGQPLTTMPEGSPSYTGHQFDASTGLIQAQQRFLDPGTGLFLSTDPAVVDSKVAGNFNRYTYAASSPYKYNDPDGRVVGKITKELADLAARKILQRQLKNARQRAVNAAWREERRLVASGKPGTRDWTAAERRELVTTGRVKGYDGDHINTVNGNAKDAGNPDNIQFLTEAEHTARHSQAGGTRVPISGGQLVDRTDGGSLPRMHDSEGYFTMNAVSSVAIGTLGVIGTVSESLDYLSLTTYLFYIPEAN